MHVYPSWRYHRTLEPRLVRDAADDAALGPEWSDSPAGVAVPTDEPPKPKRGRPAKAGA